jgi:putative transposase
MEEATPLVCSHSVSTLLAHLVWTTAARARVLVPDIDEVLAGWLRDKAQECGCHFLIAGNADDHVHVLVQHPPAVPVAELARLLKGSTSHRAGIVYGPVHRIRWQSGYWAESVCPAHVASIASYVRGQREHHASSMGSETWEAVQSAR